MLEYEIESLKTNEQDQTVEVELGIRGLGVMSAMTG